MTTLYAQPYDISANGFYFDTVDDYNEKATKLLNSYGQPVEEFELQFIDGESIDADLFKVLFTCCGPCAMLACLAKTTGGFLIAASVSKVARHCPCAFKAKRI
jgi:hypothetical protein